MSSLSTHVLDTSLGCPASAVPIVLSAANSDNTWTEVARGSTNNDGRATDFLGEDQRLEAGTYRVTFDTETYFTAIGARVFYPVVHVVFLIHEEDEHYHIPLLLSPYGYSTYRGS